MRTTKIIFLILQILLFTLNINNITVNAIDNTYNSLNLYVFVENTLEIGISDNLISFNKRNNKNIYNYEHNFIIKSGLNYEINSVKINNLNINNFYFSKYANYFFYKNKSEKLNYIEVMQK